ncbi:MAG: hypothetical protein Q8Q14_06670 [Gemmatimonadales bacterium]|nr:hypothetical protein [Gemmatimonadales bacterium]
MEGVLALMIPVIAVWGFFAWMISVSPVGKAIAERLRHGVVPPPARRGAGVGAGAGAMTDEEHDELVDGVDQLRREVAELAERVDFTERMLGQQRAADRLSGGPS